MQPLRPADLCNGIVYNHYSYYFEALIIAINYFMKQQEEEMLKGHAGVAIAYMNEGDNLIKMMKFDPTINPKDGNTILKDYHNRIQASTKDVREKNDTIYHCTSTCS